MNISEILTNEEAAALKRDASKEKAKPSGALSSKTRRASSMLNTGILSHDKPGPMYHPPASLSQKKQAAPTITTASKAKGVTGNATARPITSKTASSKK